MNMLEYIYYGILFFLPVYLVRFSLAGARANLLEIGIIVLPCIWVCVSRESIIADAKRFYKEKKALLLGVSLIFLGFILGTLVNGHLHTGLGILKGWLALPFMFSFVGYALLRTEQQKQRAFFAIFLSGLATAGIVFTYWLKSGAVLANRLTLWYESPNMLAMYEATALLIGAQWLAQSEKRKAKHTLEVRDKRYELRDKNKREWYFVPRNSYLIILCVLAFFALSLLLTHSVGALLGIAGAGVSAALYLRKEKWRKLWITWVICAVLISFFAPLASLFINPWQMGRTSLASRAMIWQVSLQILSQHWFLGIGPGTFQENYLAQQKNFSPFLEWSAPHPHNIFLMTWLYGGLLGLIGLFAILYYFFSSVQKRSSFSLVVSCQLLVVSYIVIHGAIDNTLWRNDTTVLFFLFVTIL